MTASRMRRDCCKDKSCRDHHNERAVQLVPLTYKQIQSFLIPQGSPTQKHPLEAPGFTLAEFLTHSGSFLEEA